MDRFCFNIVESHLQTHGQSLKPSLLLSILDAILFRIILEFVISHNSTICIKSLNVEDVEREDKSSVDLVYSSSECNSS